MDKWEATQFIAATGNNICSTCTIMCLLIFCLRYEIILRDGLPDWRMPVYYYRRVRKMGLFEFMILLFFILTIGHYLVAWSIYLEKKFEMVSWCTCMYMYVHVYACMYM